MSKVTSADESPDFFALAGDEKKKRLSKRFFLLEQKKWSGPNLVIFEFVDEAKLVRFESQRFLSRRLI